MLALRNETKNFTFCFSVPDSALKIFDIFGTHADSAHPARCHATADDDDTTVGTAPVIVNLIDSWDPSTGQFEFQIAVTDSDCNLGNPTILWSWNGVSQTPQVLSGAPLGCLGTIYFWVGGVPGSTVTATFQVLDSLGEFSNIWSVTSTAN